MSIKKDNIIQFFRYLWIAISVVIIFFVISQAIYTKRTLEYNLDFSQSSSQNITGWYPEQRLVFSQFSSLAYSYDAIAEPLYMKIYTPIDFEIMNIQGTIIHRDREVRLGLRQSNGSWEFKNIETNDFELNFDLENAQIKNNQLEIILSIPSMEQGSRVNLNNNWKIILSR